MKSYSYKVTYKNGGSIIDRFNTIGELAKHLEEYKKSFKYGQYKAYEIITTEINI